MMKKTIMIGFVLFCTVAASFAMKWQGNAFMYGATDYTENFFSFLYNSQLSPQLLTGIELSALIKSDDKRFFFTQEAELSVKGGNRYWKNALVYYTDKTYSLDIQADYRFLANFRFVEPFAFYVGMGASFVTRSDCYSIGKVFNYTNLRVTPFLPTVANGIRLYYKDLLRFRFHDEIGAMVGLAFYFRQDEAFDLDNAAAYYFYNMFRCSCEVKLYKRIWLAAGYQNKIIAGLSCQNLTGRIFWSNMGFLGVNVELF